MRKLSKGFWKMGKLFGTDGVRGVVGHYPMVPEFALKLGQAVGVLLGKDKRKVAICKDTRASGDMLEAVIVAGLNSVGVDALSLGVLPTPAMVALCESFGVDAAVVITASHNPFDNNGIKLLDGRGEKLPDAVTDAIEALIESGDFAIDAGNLGRAFADHSAVAKYAEKARAAAASGGGDLKGLRVVLDCANGVLAKIMPEVFKDSGAGVIAIGDAPDGYNINRGCGSTDTALLCETVVKSKAHLGIAADGDGDRILICDELGSKVDGDQIIAFLAQALAADKAVATIVSNFGLERHFGRLGVGYWQSAVGERYVVDKMREVGARVGGEESGHMVLLDYAKSGDALIAGLVIAKAVLASGKKASELFPVFAPVPKKRMDVKFVSRGAMEAAVAAPAVKAAIAAGSARLSASGKVLVRCSGTEPKVQVWTWGEDAALVEEANAAIVSEIDKFK